MNAVTVAALGAGFGLGASGGIRTLPPQLSLEQLLLLTVVGFGLPSKRCAELCIGNWDARRTPELGKTLQKSLPESGHMLPLRKVELR